jgi:hypothetical protein
MTYCRYDSALVLRTLCLAILQANTTKTKPFIRKPAKWRGRFADWNVLPLWGEDGSAYQFPARYATELPSAILNESAAPPRSALA